MNNPNQHKSSSPLGRLDSAFFHKLTSHYKERFPFVVYRKPNQSKVSALLQQNSNTYFVNDFTEEGFVFAPFDGSSKTLLIPKKEAEVLKIEYELEGKKRGGIPQENKIPVFTGIHHIQLVQKGIDEIKSEKLQKVVLSRKQEVSVSKEKPLVIFQRLLAAYPTAFVYCWFHPETGFWLGATPETLLESENNQLKTMALAGTQKYEGTISVFWGEKEKEEQQLVTDSIISDLRGKVENLKISEPETMRAGSLLHLRTNLSGKMKTFNLKEILHNLHPTPAVCGLPKQAAKDFILENEGYDREFYTGFLGELNLKTKKQRSGRRRNQENQAYVAIKKKTTLFVNLRCMKFEDEKAVLFVGGGITSDSDPKSEWQETVNKAQTMLNVL